MLKPKYTLSGAPVFTFSLPVGATRPTAPGRVSCVTGYVLCLHTASCPYSTALQQDRAAGVA